MSIEKITAALDELRDEYQQPHDNPWIVAYSAGKDSTLLLQLVVEMLLRLAPSDRKRRVYVVSNDTGVESPLLSTHQLRSLERIGRACEALRIPVTVHLTKPDPKETFWVCLIGKGYKAPSRTFRWCTDRMKIEPTSLFIKDHVSAAGQVILLLGVRSAESSKRAESIARHGTSRLNPHSDLAGCMVFRPIKDFTTEEVWQILLQRPPPWGGSHRELVTLYRNASAGECPLVIDRAQAPSCGTSSSRFGCWTCTVVDKDRSGEAIAENGFEQYEPLLAFRDWLSTLSEQSDLRQLERRNGEIRFMDNGKRMMGPFTLDARQMILDRLLDTQKAAGMVLISEEEIQTIKRIWVSDLLATVSRNARGEIKVVGPGRQSK